MSDAGIGAAPPRKEDARLLTGHGRFVDDMRLDRQCWAAFLRSPHAHAQIRAIDISAAVRSTDVLAVLTGADLAADGLGPLPCEVALENADGSPILRPPRPALAAERVRHVGDTVAMVVAETRPAALEALELIDVDYAAMASVTDVVAATEEGAPRVWDAPRNLCFNWEVGDEAATEAAFANAAHRVALELVNNRVVPNPLETRSAIGSYDAGDGRYTLHTQTQGSHMVRGLIARRVLHVPETALRVVTPDVGGSFGMKMYLYPEQVLVLWAARRLGRPVRWRGERSDAFMTDSHGRDHATRAELALDAEGRFLAVRVSTRANLGAYLSTLGPFIPSKGGARAMTGPYEIPTAHVRVRGVFTNTTPVDAYRGAGRPEYVYALERLVSTAARRLGLDPAEIRRRNFVPPGRMPYRTALGQLYDSGEFAANLEQALELSERADLPRRRERSARDGLLRGVGLCCYVEPCGGMRDQFAGLEIGADGSVSLAVGAQAAGQGHETAFAQLVAQRLPVPFERVSVLEGDTDRIAYGRGTSGSRSLPIGGPAVALAVEKAVAKIRLIAAHALEAAEADLEADSAGFHVAGTDRAVGFGEIAALAYQPERLPPGLEPGLHFTGHYDTRDTTYPNGAHIAEVEVDPRTGRVGVKRYVAVDDFGVVLNPMLVEGQVHGGIAQGLGQALAETCVYEAGTGQLLTASFLDYALPLAGDLPMFRVAQNEVPCRTNVLGVKGCGEAGAIAAPPAVIDAVLDALTPLGVAALDMPATPSRVWAAIRGADAGRSATGPAD